jgi:hypothetical protein
MSTPNDATAAKLDTEPTSASPQTETRSGTAKEPPETQSGYNRRANINLAIACACYVGFSSLLGLARVNPRHLGLGLPLLVLGTTLVFMLLQLWVPWTVVKVRQPLKATVQDMFMYLCLWGVLTCVLNWVGPIKHLPALVMVPLTGLIGLCMTLALSLFGLAVSFIVREAKIIVPLCIIAGIIDILGAMTPFGFTANALRRNHQLVTHVSVPVPAIHGLPVLATIGPGDPVFIAFFFAIVVRHQLNQRGTFWAMYGMLTLSMIVVSIGLIKALAALAPMSVAVITSNMRYFQFDRSEKFAMVYVAVIVIAAALLFFFYTNAHMYHHPGGGLR